MNCRLRSAAETPRTALRSINQTTLPLQWTVCWMNASETVFEEIIWILKLLEDSSVNGHVRSSWRCYYPLSFVIIICQVMVLSLLYCTSCSSPGLVKSPSMTSQAGLAWLADGTGYQSAPASSFTSSTASRSWGKRGGVAVAYSKCNSNFQNECYSTSYNYSSLGY